MNLNVNLLRADEKRSASLISMKTVVIALGILILGALLLPFILKAATLTEIQRQHRHVDLTRREIESRADGERRRDRLLKNVEEFDREFAFWREVKPMDARLLFDVAAVAPTNVQFTRLTMQDTLATKAGRLVRQQQLTLHCLVTGAEPESAIQGFHAKLVDLLGADADPIRDFRPANPEQTEHSFRIICRFERGEPEA